MTSSTPGHVPGRSRIPLPPGEPVTDTAHTPVLRTYGCSFGCGNPFDYILIDQESSETLFLCVPCFLTVAQNIGAAIFDPDNETVRMAVEQMPAPEQAPVKSADSWKPTGVYDEHEDAGACPECGAGPAFPHADDCYFGV